MIETHGGALAKLVDGNGPEGKLASRLLAEHGLEEARPWFPLHSVLAILNHIGRELGDETLFRIGASVPDVAGFPASIDTISKALRSLDVAYHMNHRKNGAPMFDNGQFTADGIGCYVCTDDTSGCFIVDSASLYPCAFDRGLVTAIAQRFEPTAQVQHLDGARCRRLGSLTCAYVITW